MHIFQIGEQMIFLDIYHLLIMLHQMHFIHIYQRLHGKIFNLFSKKKEKILNNRFRNDIHIVHFAGALKPWQLTYNPENEQLSGNLGGQSDIQRDFLLSWWRIMYQRVWPYITQFNQVNHFIFI